MSFNLKLLTPQELKEELPLISPVSQFRNTIVDIINGSHNQIFVAVGPCSVHSVEGAMEYANKFHDILSEVNPLFFPILRLHLEKPRTRYGWQGFLYDEERDINESLRQGRRLMVEITKLGLPISMELLNPMLVPYFSDLISYGIIGARTVTSQLHRQLAGMLPFPIGFKNDLSGDVQPAIDAVLVGRKPQQCVNINDEGVPCSYTTAGNPLTHIILRGGSSGPNYSSECIDKCLQALKEEGLPPRAVIDCAHGNSQGDFRKQAQIFEACLHNGPEKVMGIMVESYLESGRDDLKTKNFSFTDPCLGWEATKKLLI